MKSSLNQNLSVHPKPLFNIYVHFSNVYLLSTYYVPGVILDAGMPVKMMDEVLGILFTYPLIFGWAGPSLLCLGFL